MKFVIHISEGIVERIESDSAPHGDDLCIEIHDHTPADDPEAEPVTISRWSGSEITPLEEREG